ncbi:MAG: TIGR02391 family protein [Actinomycetia bacterium]|nr:TIGR02391 family protein [Actinomycetes bacterium]
MRLNGRQNGANAGESYLEDLALLVVEFHTKNDGQKSELESNSEKISKAVAVVKRSWSNSFAGWHGSMYFLDFQPPGIHERFEWSPVEGIPPGWYEQEPDAVKNKLEELVGDSFSFDEFEKKTEQFRTEVENLKDDVLGALSRIPVKSLTEEEQKILSELKETGLGETRDDFVFKGLPSHLMTNDVDALAQGTMIPAWLYYYAIGLSAESLCRAVDSLLRLTERMSRQVAGKAVRKTDSTDLHPVIVEKCFQLYLNEHYSEAAEKSFKIVKDRLRDLTGEEQAFKAFGAGLHINGAAAPNVDDDFNEAVKFLTMAIHYFKNEKGHTADGNISDPVRAYQYLAMSSLALSFLDHTDMRIPPKQGKGNPAS